MFGNYRTIQSNFSQTLKVANVGIIANSDEEIIPWTQYYFWNLNLGTLLHCVHNALLSIATEKISLRRGNTVHGNELVIK